MLRLNQKLDNLSSIFHHTFNEHRIGKMLTQEIVPILLGLISEGIFKIFGVPKDISGIRYYLIIAPPLENVFT